MAHATRFRCLDGGSGFCIALAMPEVGPGTAPDCVEVADLHHALATLAHEDEPCVQIEHLDAIVGGGQHAPQERRVPVQGQRICMLIRLLSPFAGDAYFPSA